MNIKKRYLATAIAATLLPIGVSASVLEEVVVTAQKREQSLQDISVSVTAYSGDQLDALGMTDTTDITAQVPGLQLNAWSPNVTIFNLRGISQNNFVDNLEAPIAVYLDDAYMGSINGISGQLFDVHRAEVLRGPQGTLFGRNATGGLIHYISEGANSEETNGYVKAGVGSFNRKNTEFAVGGGLSDTVRARVAGRWEQADGYVKAQIPGAVDVGGADGFALRTNVQVDFSDALTGDFWVKYSKDTDVPTGGYVFENCNFLPDGNCPVDIYGRALTTPGNAANDVHKHLGENPGSLDRTTKIYQAKFTYDLGDNELVSITNYTDLEKSYVEDGDALPLVIVNFETDARYKQFSQEFRLSGESERSRWQTGLYYLNIEIEGDSRTIGAPAFGNILAAGRVPTADASALSSASPDNGFENAVGRQVYTQESKNWSVFGQIEFDISDTLMLTTGARWSQDDKDIDWRLTYTDTYNTSPIIVNSSAGYAATINDADTIDYGDWAARIALDWRASDTTLVFASVNRGIKGGNFNLSAGASAVAENFKHNEEVLYSYELGFKTDFEEQDLRVNATAFYYDYDDYQAFSLVGLAPLVSNSDASSFGGELEAVWTPGDNWDFNFGLAYVESEVEIVNGSGQPISNAEFPNAPKLSVNYLARYNWDLSDNGAIAAQIDGVWNDDQYLEVTNGPGTLQESYALTNLRLTYTDADDRLSVSLFAKNITDEEFKVYTLDLGALGVTTFYAPPTTYGASVKYRWN